MYVFFFLKNVTEEISDAWEKITLQRISYNYVKGDIYQVDKFGLFCHALPIKSHSS